MSRAGAPRRATIVDVAARAGVSRQTVSRAINDLPGISGDTRDRVLAAAEELHYRPSRFGRGLVSAGPPTVGLLVDDLGNAFFPEIARALVREAAARGWNVVLAETGGAPDPSAVARDLAHRADALLGYGLPHAGDLGVPARMPLVRLDVPADSEEPGVVFEDGGALADLAAHLHAAGSRTAAVLDHADDRPTDRARRLHAALVAGGHEVIVVPSGPDGVPGQLAAVGGARPSVDTVLCWNDAHAFAVLRHLRAAGVTVPDDLRVVGVDGLAIGELVGPALTTVGVDMVRAAAAAVDLVEGLFTGGLATAGAAARRTVPYRLLVRESA